MLLMPIFDSLAPVVLLAHPLLPLRPPHPVRFARSHDTDHFVRDGQFSIDARSERVDELRPGTIEDPEHCAAVRTEAPLRIALLLRFSAAVFDGIVFPIERC